MNKKFQNQKYLLQIVILLTIFVKMEVQSTMMEY